MDIPTLTLATIKSPNMGDIIIRLKNDQAAKILKALGGFRVAQSTPETDAVQEFLQTLSTKLFADDARRERKAKNVNSIPLP